MKNTVMFLLLGVLVQASVSQAEVNLVPHHCRIGEVTQIMGSVELERRSVIITPVSGTKVCRGDQFRTAPGAIAEIKFRDGTKVTVGKDSEFAIRDFRINTRKPNVALFDLIKGAFRSVTGTITKRRNRFEVTTRAATIGIRGTEFWGGYGLTPDGAFDVVMLEGRGVYVKNARGQVELDQAGLGTTIKEGEAPTTPQKWGEEKLKRALETLVPDTIARN